MGGYRQYWQKKKANMLPKEKLTVEMKIYICPKIHEQLTQLSKGPDGLPVSRYVQIALDNEMDQSNPFNYPMTFQDEPYVEDKYAHEAQLIFNFTRKYSMKGISLMMLMLLRRMVGIQDRERVFRGYNELVKSGMVEEIVPKGDDAFSFPRWYRKIKVKDRVTV